MIQLGSFPDVLCSFFSNRASTCEQISVSEPKLAAMIRGPKNLGMLNSICSLANVTKIMSEQHILTCTTDSLRSRYCLKKCVNPTVEPDERVASCGLHENDKNLACLFQTIHYVMKQPSPFLNVLFAGLCFHFAACTDICYDLHGVVCMARCKTVRLSSPGLQMCPMPVRAALHSQDGSHKSKQQRRGRRAPQPDVAARRLSRRGE